MAAAATTMRRGRRSNKVALMLSLLFGVMAAVLAFPLLTTRSNDAAPPPIVMAPIVVAAKDVAPRTVLTADMLTVRSVPADGMHPDSITALDQAVGQVTQYPLIAGEPLLSPKLTTTDAGLGLAGTVPQGKRAVSVEVNDVRGSAGLINPGDKVDVYAAFDKTDTSIGEHVGILVLQDVTIIAVAQELNSPDPNNPESIPATNSKGDTTRTVTLAIAPEEVERLVLADEKGILRLALRGKDDATIGAGTGITLSELIGREAPAQ